MRLKPKHSTLSTFWWLFPPTGILLWPLFGILSIPPLKRLVIWFDGLQVLRQKMERQYAVTRMANFAVKDIDGEYHTCKNPFHEDFRPLREFAFTMVYWALVRRIGPNKAVRAASQVALAALSTDFPLDETRFSEPRLATVHHEEDGGVEVLELEHDASLVSITVGQRVYDNTMTLDYFVVGAPGAIGPIVIPD